MHPSVKILYAAMMYSMHGNLDEEVHTRDLGRYGALLSQSKTVGISFSDLNLVHRYVRSLGLETRRSRNIFNYIQRGIGRNGLSSN